MTSQVMTSMKKLILVLIVFFAAGYGLLSYHFILFDDRLKILKKTSIRYENTLVDARGVKKLDLLLEPDLIEAGVKDLIRQVESAADMN